MEKIKRRIALISVSILFLIFLGNFLYINYADYKFKWTVEKLVIAQFAFFDTFTISVYTAYFWTLLVFGIFVLPFVFDELGFLDDYDESPDPYMEERVDRLAGFPKSRFGFVAKIKNYSLPVGILTATIGSYLMVLPSIYFVDKWVLRVYESGELAGQEYWYLEKYYGFLRGYLLLIGVLLLVIGLILIIHHIRQNPYLTIKEKPQAS